MDASRWERIGAASGVVFVGLMIAAFSFAASEPKHSDVDGLASYIADNRTGYLVQSYLFGLASLFLLWFAGSVRTHIRRNEGASDRLSSIGFGGAIVATTLALISTTVYAVAAFRANEVQDPAIVRLLADVGTIAATLFFVPFAAWVGATAIASYRSGAFPKWHAITGGIIAVAFAAVPAVLFGESGFFSADEWAVPGVASFLLFAYILTTSVMLIVGEAAKAEPAIEQPHVGWHRRRAVG